jgi:hypothetical protein
MRTGLRMGTVIVGGLIALLVDAQVLAPRTGGEAIAATGEIVADAELQAGIARVARAEGAEDVAAALDALRRLSAPDFSDLVPQLAIFLLGADGEREGMAPAVVVDRLGISRAQILRAVEPHLGISDGALRAQLENLLGAVDGGPAGSVDFGEYRALIAERRASPPAALVAYMFERSPADAATTLGEVYASGAARSAASAQVSLVEGARGALARTGSLPVATRAQVASTLEALARHPDWWVRCYAAAVLRENARLADLGGAAVRERLANDPDERVRNALR